MERPVLIFFTLLVFAASPANRDEIPKEILGEINVTNIHDQRSCKEIFRKGFPKDYTFPVYNTALVLLILLLLLRLILVPLIVYQDNIRCNNAVMAIDWGEQVTELAFSCNRYPMSDDYIYKSPLPAQDNGSSKTQMVP